MFTFALHGLYSDLNHIRKFCGLVCMWKNSLFQILQYLAYFTYFNNNNNMRIGCLKAKPLKYMK